MKHHWLSLPMNLVAADVRRLHLNARKIIGASLRRLPRFRGSRREWFRGILSLAAVLAAFPSADAATLTLFAGGGTRVAGPATECRLADPFAVEFDAQGNAFICEMTNNRVLRVDPRGQLTTVGGTGRKGSGGLGQKMNIVISNILIRISEYGRS